MTPVGLRYSTAVGRVSRSEVWTLAAIVAIGAALRLSSLDRVPPAMNQDEVLRGYDAWCLWETRGDYRGNGWPLFLEAYGPGEYVTALSAYLTAPLVGLFGPHVWVVRWPLALSGTATLLLAWWWLRREVAPAAGLAAAVFLAISPWHVHVSRMGLEGNLAPLWVTLGVACGLGSAATRGWVRWLGGAALGLAMWTYPAPRLGMPVLAAAWAAWRLRDRGRGAMRDVGLLALGIAAGSLPLWLTLMQHPEQLFARASHVSLLQNTTLSEALAVFIRQYAEHFNPVTMVWVGERATHQFPPEFGFVTVAEWALMVVGVGWLAAAGWRGAIGRLLLVWLLLYPVPAALTRGGMPSMVRSNLGLPLLSSLAGIGLWQAWHVCRRGGARVAGMAVGLLVAAALICSGRLMWYYFARYPASVAAEFNTSLVGAFQWHREHRRPDDVVLVSFRANQAFAYYLFFDRVAPCAALAMPVDRRPWTGGFEQVVRWGDAHFCPADLGRDMNVADVNLWAGGIPRGRRVLVMARPGQFADGAPAAKIVGPDGGVAVEVYDWRGQ